MAHCSRNTAILLCTALLNGMSNQVVCRPCFQFTPPHVHVCYIHKQADPTLSKKGSAGMYGMVGMIPDKAIVKDFVIEFFNEVYTL